LKLLAVSERRCCRKTPLARDLRINRNPNAAKLFIDFVLLEEGQKIFVQKGRESARVGLKPEGYPSHLKLAPSRMALAEKLADYTRRYESSFVKR
jgi:ABC-type Fe3+ transport system substrate-binding protein